MEDFAMEDARIVVRLRVQRMHHPLRIPVPAGRTQAVAEIEVTWRRGAEPGAEPRLTTITTTGPYLLTSGRLGVSSQSTVWKYYPDAEGFVNLSDPHLPLADEVYELAASIKPDLTLDRSP